MFVTDPIADMLTRIRNAIIAKHDKVDIPRSNVKVAIAKILFEEGYVKSIEEIGEGYEGVISIKLKYGSKNESVITGLKRISKPGLRIYVNSDKLPKVLGGLGVAIVSTNKGIMTDKKARASKVGGEVMAYIW